MAEKVGRDNIFTAVVHMDETTPHMHLCFTPITEDGRLTAKEVIGDRNRLTQWQDDYFSYMVKAYPDLERGESASVTGRRHVPTKFFKMGVNLNKKKAQIESVLNGINPLNIGKKRDEAIALIKKFIPGLEDYEKQARKYRKEIKVLETENTELEKKAEASEQKAAASENARKGKMLANAQVQADLYNLQRFVDSLPEDIKQEARQQMKQSRPRNQQQH